MAVGSATLKDGTPIIVRPVAVSDRHLLEEGFQRLSRRSRYQRFFRVTKRLRDEELDFFVNVDHDEHEAVGVLAEDGSTGLGIARYIRLAPHSPDAEVAIVVADDAQGKGVGRVLMEALAERARANGVQRFVAQTGAGNRPFRRLAERLGPTRVLAVVGGTIELETTL
jgi:GNAT superfamily N-acetyltransferase